MHTPENLSILNITIGSDSNIFFQNISPLIFPQNTCYTHLHKNLPEILEYNY